MRRGGSTHPRVFVVYSHGSDDHRERIWSLVHRLREQGGVDAWFDGYEQAPPEGWPQWSMRQIDDADFVLVVCTPSLRRRFDGTEAKGRGLGTRWEAKAITDRLYDASGCNERFIPLLLDAEPEHSIPKVLQGYHFVRYPEREEELLRLLHRSPLRVPVAVSGKPHLPEAKRPPRPSKRKAPGGSGSRLAIVGSIIGVTGLTTLAIAVVMREPQQSDDESSGRLAERGTGARVSPANDGPSPEAGVASGTLAQPNRAAGKSGVTRTRPEKATVPVPRRATSEKPLAWLDPRRTPDLDGPQLAHLPHCSDVQPPCEVSPSSSEPMMRVEVRDNKIVLNEQVQFASDSSDVLPVSHSLLKDVTKIIVDEVPRIERIIVEGHLNTADEIASELSLGRARAVREVLVEYGVSVPVDAYGWGAQRQGKGDSYGETRIDFTIASIGKRGYKQTKVHFRCLDGSTQQVSCRTPET